METTSMETWVFCHNPIYIAFLVVYIFITFRRKRFRMTIQMQIVVRVVQAVIKKEFQMNFQRFEGKKFGWKKILTLSGIFQNFAC